MKGPSPWISWKLRPAAEGDTVVGVYGGHPRGIRNHDWPRCAVCGQPMCHMAQIDAGPWLDLGTWSRMTLFICHATGGRCEDWDPRKGANRILLQRYRDENKYDGPPTVRVYRRLSLAATSVDERQYAGRPTRENVELLRYDKLGGGAVWLHGDDTPQGSTGAPMRMLLQITTNIVAFDITPSGMAYVFIDGADPSDQAAKLLWQGS